MRGLIDEVDYVWDTIDNCYYYEPTKMDHYSGKNFYQKMDSVRGQLVLKLTDGKYLEEADKEFAEQVDNSAFALHLFIKK